MWAVAYAYSFGKLHDVYFLLLNTYQLATSHSQSKTQLSSDIIRVFWFEISTYGCFLSFIDVTGDGICPLFHTICVLMPPLGGAFPLR